MDTSNVVAVMQDAIMTVMVASAPMLIVGMVVGIVVSIFQATTQINEQTLAFVPKIIAIFLTLLIFWGFISNSLTDLTYRIFENLGAPIP